MKTSAIVIPIKTNNQRLPGKNTKKLSGKPLYTYIFNTVLKCKEVNSIYIDSSDDFILKEANAFGFKTIKRPSELNSNKTSGNDLLEFELNFIKEDIICQVFVTTPFLKSSSIDKSIRILKENNFSSVLPLSKVEDRFWFNSKPVNHEYNKLLGTQYEKPLYRESGFYAFLKKDFLNEKSRITKNRTILEIDRYESIDIDTKLDFALAEAVCDINKNYEYTCL